MRKIYQEVLRTIKSLDFNLIYPNFKRYQFALYNKETIYLETESIPYQEKFIGNTAITYQNEEIAIWFLENTNMHVDVLSSKIIHEMFHCFQKDNHETRWANEMDALNYRYDEQNITIKHQEVAYLIKAFEKVSINDFNLFAKTRNLRAKNYSVEVAYEKQIETIEGMATYIELKTLKMLNLHYYEKNISEITDYLKQKENLLNVRLYAYYTGVLIQLNCDQFRININHKIGEEVKALFDLTKSHLKLDTFKPTIKSINLGFLTVFKSKREETVQGLLKQTTKTLYPDKIIGLDPMNTYKVNKHVVFNHFVMVQLGEAKQTIMGKSVGKFNAKGELINLKIVG